MSGNDNSHSSARSIDPVKELDDVIRLVRFLGKCKPQGFTASLGWVEERLEVIRGSLEEMRPDWGVASAEGAPHSDQPSSFATLRNLAALCAD